MGGQADVGVVGAGPAGSRAAELLARQGASVVLFDPRAPWEKPCGGGLTPPVFDEFPELEEIKPLAYPVERAWVEAGPDASFEVELRDRIWIISRRQLGRWQLQRALEAGAVHEAAKVERIRRSGEGWALDVDGDSCEVAYLIGADGAASSVRHAVAPQAPVELVPARVAYPLGQPAEPAALLLRFYGDVGGYLWDFPRPDHRSVGIEITKGARNRTLLDERIDEYGHWETQADPRKLDRAGAVIGTAGLGRGDFSAISGPGFALLGDAAGLADPLTGEGIRNALRSAALLARARRVRPEAWSETYASLARRTFAREFAMSRLLRRWLSETGVGVRLVGRAMSSDAAYATVAAILHALMMQDYRLRRFLGHWRRAHRSILADPGRRGGPSTTQDGRRHRTAGHSS